MAGTFTLTGASNGLPGGSVDFGPITTQGAALIGEVLPLSLVSGDNVIAVPLGAVTAVIVPPTGNTTPIAYRTSLNADDVGLPINSGTVASTFKHDFPATAPTSIILNAGSAISAFTEIRFI